MNLIVRQTDLSDCGIACTVSILKYYGIQRELYQLKLKHPLKFSYYSFSDLSNLLKEFKLETIGYHTDIETLKLIDEPVIAQLVIIKNIYFHFVVINHLDEDNIYYMDPAKGRIIKCPINKFSKIWSGKILKVVNDKSKEYKDAFFIRPPRLMIQIINRRSYIALTLLVLLTEFVFVIIWLA